MATWGVNKLRGVIEKSDRILTGDLGLTVSLNVGSGTSAISGNDIMISLHGTNLDGSISEDMILSAMGANYHELSHYFFSDHRGLTMGMKSAWNILEDQKIETLFIGLYPVARFYFRNMIAEYILGVKDTEKEDLISESLFCLVYGRKYLSKKLRDSAEARWAFGNKEEIKECIDQYKEATPGSKEWRDIINRFAELMPDRAKEEFGNEPMDITNKSKPSFSDEKSARESIEENGEEFEDEEPGGSGSGESDDSEEAEPSDIYNDAIMDSAHDEQSGTNESEEVQDDLDEVKKGMAAGSASVPRNPEAIHDMPVTQEMRDSSQRLIQHFRKLSDEVQPGWNYSSDSGRLNVQSFIDDPYAYEEMFDEWDSGKTEDASIEVVLSLDMSASMYGVDIFSDVEDGLRYPVGELDATSPATQACKVVWIIASACQEVDVPVTVIEYGGATFEVKSKNEKVSNTTWKLDAVSLGGTQPRESFSQAADVFKNSDSKHQILYAVTDGAWGEHCEDVLQEITAYKSFVGILQSAQGVGRFFDSVSEVSSPSEIADIVERDVASVLAMEGRNR